MLAVMPRHLFVLVCDESLKHVACPNWECFPFSHLYKSNDPSAHGWFFIGFPGFNHFALIWIVCLPQKGPSLVPGRLQIVVYTMWWRQSIRAKYLPCVHLLAAPWWRTSSPSLHRRSTEADWEVKHRSCSGSDWFDSHFMLTEHELYSKSTHHLPSVVSKPSLHLL